tara:strand:- start:3949 stop:4755 length:807 start_codon:yes stop_codon:yes gene_type:complete
MNIKQHNNQFCNNCGKIGHGYNRCSKPIISSGIIAFNKHEEVFKYLLICRKDSLGYVEFIRGKYPLYNKTYIQNLINEMTIKEKNNLLSKEFEDLWKDLWGEYFGTQYRSEETNSKNKFNNIKDGIHLYDNTFFNLEQIIQESTTNWIEPEWGFPKGRRNYQENDINCALREFSEETGFQKKNINLIKNIIPFEEIFTGSNYKSYKHKYFLGHIKSYISSIGFQQSEVSKMKWLNLEDCVKHIRPYNFERIEIIKNIDQILHKYSLFS